MKKIVFVLFTVLLTNFGVKAQTWSEWFNQKSTQKKYLIQQIAALRVYADFARDGYKIAKVGLNTIGDLSRGEFNLHEDYFTSLKNVNPKIRSYHRVPEIIDLQIRISNGYGQIRTEINQSNAFTTTDRDYITGVYSRLITECEKTIGELLAVVSDYKLEMTDEQRINRIDQIFMDMQQHYGFYQSFTNGNKMLHVARSKEQKEVQNSRTWNGINQ